MEKRLSEQIEEAVTNGLGYSPIRDPTRPMRDERRIDHYMSKEEIRERFETPVEQTTYGLKSHLKSMELKTGAFAKKIKEMQEIANQRRLEAISNPSSIQLRTIDSDRYTIIDRLR